MVLFAVFYHLLNFPAAAHTPMTLSPTLLISGAQLLPIRTPSCCVPSPASNARVPSGDRPSHALWQPLGARVRQVHGTRRLVDATHSACCSLTIALSRLEAFQSSYRPLLHTPPTHFSSSRVPEGICSPVQFCTIPLFCFR